mmetsp:Transcript_1106/g.1377  ORF Transcript_1106/g.1377 Transcript_1106/m.1377 type:complete len:129 (+) Transcript_1106:46-432(+)
MTTYINYCINAHYVHSFLTERFHIYRFVKRIYSVCAFISLSEDTQDEPKDERIMVQTRPAEHKYVICHSGDTKANCINWAGSQKAYFCCSSGKNCDLALVKESLTVKPASAPVTAKKRGIYTVGTMKT